ncbi:MAG: DUF2341 domain-containing protein [Candidatus Bathyarchaeota archaeon]
MKKVILAVLGVILVFSLIAGYNLTFGRISSEIVDDGVYRVQVGSLFSNWTYFKVYNITGSTAGAQTDYQMKFTLHYGSGPDLGEHIYLDGLCQEDFDDIRFVWYNNSDGSEVACDYWLEKKVDNDYGIFWAEIIYIPASPENATIHIYYGNPEAICESDGDETFIFWDDFETDLSKWTIRNGTAVERPRLSGNYSYQGNQAVEIQRKGNDIRINTSTTTNTAVRVWFYDLMSERYEMQIMSGGGVGVPGIGLIGVLETRSSTKYAYRIGMTSYASSVERTVGWHLFEITNYDSVKKFWIDGHRQQLTDNTTISNFRLGSWWETNDEYGYFDVSIQRKYVFPEPNHAVPAWVRADLNRDGRVDMRDIGIVARAFGSYPGHERWNVEADITGSGGEPDDRVDMRDIGLVARNFGQPTEPSECEELVEDFEGYQVGEFPSSGSWELWYPGIGRAHQIIVNHTSFSQNNSLQLLGWGIEGGSHMSAIAAYPWDCNNGVSLYYSVYVMVDEVCSFDFSAVMGFGKAVPGGTKRCNGVYFAHDGMIKAMVAGDEFISLQSYEPDTWYKIEALLDTTTDTFNVWIDDELVGSDLHTRFPSSEIEAFLLLSRYANTKAYFDDITAMTW